MTRKSTSNVLFCCFTFQSFGNPTIAFIKVTAMIVRSKMQPPTIKDKTPLPLYGYARASTDGQELGFKLDTLIQEGCERCNIYTDKVSVAKVERVGLNAVLDQLKEGVGELDQEKLPNLLALKYHSINDANKQIGIILMIRNAFIEFQSKLYSSEQH